MKLTKSHFLLIVVIVLVFVAGYYLGNSNAKQEPLDDQDYSKNNPNAPSLNSSFQAWGNSQVVQRSKLDQVRAHCKKENLGAAIKMMEQEEHPEHKNEIISLRSRYTDLNRKVLQGVLSTEEEQIAQNKLRSVILNFAEDFYPQNSPSAVSSISS